MQGRGSVSGVRVGGPGSRAGVRGAGSGGSVGPGVRADGLEAGAHS